jgi:Clp amino terminal domain, pathogenicity island component
MFNLEKAIVEWRRQMTVGGIRSPRLLDELESHLRDDMEQQILSGSDPQQAFEAAVQKIGRADALKCEFEKVGGWMWALVRKLKGFVAGDISTPFPPLNNFNTTARQTLEFARAEAPRFHHDFIGTEHVLLGLLKSEKGVVHNLLRRFGVDCESIRMEIEKVVGIGSAHESTAPIPFTPRARKALEIATKEAHTLNQADVGAEHIFLGLLIEGSGVAALVLKNLGVRIERTREELLKELDPKRNKS